MEKLSFTVGATNVFDKMPHKRNSDLRAAQFGTGDNSAVAAVPVVHGVRHQRGLLLRQAGLFVLKAHMKRTLSRRDFLNWAGAVGGSTAVYRAAMGIGLLPVAARAARPLLTASGKSKKVLILGAGISGLTVGLRAEQAGLRGAGARGLVPRGRPQHDGAAWFAHRRDRLSAGLQFRRRPGPVLQLRAGAHPGAPRQPARATARSSRSSSSRSSTTTAMPGCRTTRCSAASRSARAST